MNSRCKKRRFKDEIAAKMALADIWHTDSSDRESTEQRAYFHRKPNGCGAWHLTSQPYDPAKAGGRSRSMSNA